MSSFEVTEFPKTSFSDATVTFSPVVGFLFSLIYLIILYLCDITRLTHLNLVTAIKVKLCRNDGLVPVKWSAWQNYNHCHKNNNSYNDIVISFTQRSIVPFDIVGVKCVSRMRYLFWVSPNKKSSCLPPIFDILVNCSNKNVTM